MKGSICKSQRHKYNIVLSLNAHKLSYLMHDPLCIYNLAISLADLDGRKAKIG